MLLILSRGTGVYLIDLPAQICLVIDTLLAESCRDLFQESQEHEKFPNGIASSVIAYGRRGACGTRRELERTQQQEDLLGFLALFDPLAVWVTSGGKRLIGLDIIGDFTRTVLPGGMSGGSVSYGVEHVLFISPNVALAGVRQQYFDRDGNPTSAGLPSYVWRRTDGFWRIIAGQNTAAEDPVVSDD